jgi:WD40 repeat protein
LLSGDSGAKVRLWPVDRAEPLDAYDEHQKSVLAVAFSDDGQYAVSVGEDEKARRWALPTGKEP